MFHTCLEPSLRSLKSVPNVYEEMITNRAKRLSCSPYLPSAILSQFLWFNLNIKIDNKSIFISDFGSKNLNFIVQNFYKNGKAKSWDYFKSECNLETKLKYCWIHLADASPKLWKDCILNCLENLINLCICSLFIFII